MSETPAHPCLFRHSHWSWAQWGSQVFGWGLVAGGRFFAVGWTCCLGMAGNFLVIPMANFTLALSKSTIVVPLIDLSTMMPVLLGMLGLGAMRTVEKTKGVQRNN